MDAATRPPDGPPPGAASLRAPRDDRGVLVAPPWEEAGRLLRQNVARLTAVKIDIAGMPLAELRRAARRELLAAARQWTAACVGGEGLPAASAPDERPLLLAGHQPQLIHPGVWMKNFALDALAAQHGAIGVNLVIDSDTLKTTVARVPSGTPERPRSVPLAFDRHEGGWPFEERPVFDEAQFRSFGARAEAALRDVLPEAMIGEFWPLVVARWEATGKLGAALAQARRQWEQGWGVRTLEAPQSAVCAAPSFLRFLVHLIEELPRFRAVHNQALAEYRRAHRIRNGAHPAPDLGLHDGWLEAPLWAWTAAAPQRRRVFVRPTREALALSDRATFSIELPRHDPEAAIERLQTLAASGVKLRSRALITTLWARLALGDLFLHGIGGAKYDHVTDALMARFFGLEPPSYMVVSATLHLPLPPQSEAADDARRLAHALRELDYHGEASIDWQKVASDGAEATVRALVADKRQWVAQAAAPETARARCRAIRAVNARLQPWVEPHRRRLSQLLRETEARAAGEAARTWREYAFCFFPAQLLRAFFAQLPRSR